MLGPNTRAFFADEDRSLACLSPNRKHKSGGGMMTSEQIETRSKKVRGMAKASIELIEAMAEIAEAAQPITGRGVGYKLFTAGLILGYGTPDMQKVYRLLHSRAKTGRSRGNGSSMRRKILNARRVGAIQKISSSLSGANTAETIGISSRLASRYGARKAPFAASSPQFSTSTASASALCTGSQARPRFTILPTMTTAANWSHSIAATTTRAASTCQSTICQTGSTNMKATTSISNGLP